MGNFFHLCKIWVFYGDSCEAFCPWDLTLFSLLKVNTFQRYMSRQLSGLKNKLLSRKLVVLSCWFVSWLILEPLIWRWHVPPKCWLIFNRLHGVSYTLEKRTFLLSPSYEWFHSAEMVIYIKHFTNMNKTQILTRLQLDPMDVLGPPKRGRRVTILGDTCDSFKMVDLAQWVTCFIIYLQLHLLFMGIGLHSLVQK
jgi:hypothetical protein